MQEERLVPTQRMINTHFATLDGLIRFTYNKTGRKWQGFFHQAKRSEHADWYSRKAHNINQASMELELELNKVRLFFRSIAFQVRRHKLQSRKQNGKPQQSGESSNAS